MKYLSIDLEATGLKEDDYIIEYAMIPFDTEKGAIEESLSREYVIKCPSFKKLLPSLDPWVIEHNKDLITRANKEGISIKEFKKQLKKYLEDDVIQKYFFNSHKEKKNKIILFGKSMNAIDLPFLTRDLSWDFMHTYFHHQVLDLSPVANALVDMNLLPEDCRKGSGLMKYLQMGEVCHTALEDARNTAIMYLKLIEKLKKLKL